jgi:hypothetical protein
MAAFQLALAIRIISFGFDESTKWGLSIMSTNVQIETAEGHIIDVVPRGAALCSGGTAEEVGAHIEKDIFSHARELLKLWKAKHEDLYGPDSWAECGGPSPEAIGLHRLAENTVIMSDTCNGARAAKRLLATMVMAAAKCKKGEAEWDAMEAEERAQYAVHLGDCAQHLRNILVNAMVSGATEHLKAELGDSLSEFSAFDRMSVDVMDLVRAAYKEMHPGGEYAKGKGRECLAWRQKHHAAALWYAEIMAGPRRGWDRISARLRSSRRGWDRISARLRLSRRG